MKHLVVGILAHVDSGKTTLSEALLYKCGGIRKLGRVDHRNSFLDTNHIERDRGITIFSKQAELTVSDTNISLLDTPGHVDFSAEMERTLQVLDYAILVISGSDGVQSHTETLWHLLNRYNIPTFIFVNKMDISFLSKESIIKELRKKLSIGCIDFSNDISDDERTEAIAECDESLMDSYLGNGTITESELVDAISDRKVFPCLFGSALKLNGVDALCDMLDGLTVQKDISSEFGARVYKITQDDSGSRLTHLKITGGSLKVKSQFDIDGKQEKINQIRIYNGVKFTTVDEASAGMICAVTGLSATKAGMGLGIEKGVAAPLLEPVLTYRLILPPKTDIPTTLSQLRKLEEEDPMLRVVWSEQLKEIHIQLMGEIQLEIIKSLIKERFSLDAEFDKGSITYKETIESPVVGVGHYEPLRHYAEVHLLMEPTERGAGLQFAVDCRKDDLDINWQRLILTHLEEKVHIGVLTGSPITDMKITIVAGKAHLKHTEGGDFRQATYRAVRQGLRSAKSVLLEPYYDFRLEIPFENTGKALTDLQRMDCSFQQPLTVGDSTIIEGTAPVAKLMDYSNEVISYTHGKGRLSCIPAGYFPCHNSEEVIDNISYDCDSDLDNSADSVFCSHGAGVMVRWDEAPSHMHVDSGIRFSDDSCEDSIPDRIVTQAQINTYKQRMATDKELMDIFERTYGKIKRTTQTAMRRDKRVEPSSKPHKAAAVPKGPEYLLVDGYNIIFAWDELNAIARNNLDAARAQLINVLCNYQGFKQNNVILVFDAYKVKGNHREIEKENNITVVYTKEAETADMYIEKTAHELGKNHRVRVATSDNVEQLIILGSGGIRVSAAEFHDEVAQVEKAIRSIIGGN